MGKEPGLFAFLGSLKEEPKVPGEVPIKGLIRLRKIVKRIKE